MFVRERERVRTDVREREREKKDEILQNSFESASCWKVRAD